MVKPRRKQPRHKRERAKNIAGTMNGLGTELGLPTDIIEIELWDHTREEAIYNRRMSSWWNIQRILRRKYNQPPKEGRR